MKVYIVYDARGYECGYIYGKNHNQAEERAIAKYGAGSSVVYTEL